MVRAHSVISVTTIDVREKVIPRRLMSGATKSIHAAAHPFYLHIHCIGDVRHLAPNAAVLAATLGSSEIFSNSNSAGRFRRDST